MNFFTEQYAKMINSIAMLKGTKGQTLVEYALLLVLIAIVVIVAVTTLGEKANNVYENIGNAINA